MILSSCAGNKLQLDSAHDLGVVNAGINLADQPADCGRNTPHAALSAGVEVRVLLKRERAQLEAANGKRFDCYTFNKGQIDGFRIGQAVLSGRKP
jgi:hypothetical protein